MEDTLSWLIVAKTNLHVGNENTTNYGIVDKGIQRDALTGLPCINSSSLKGAINEFCTYQLELDKSKRLDIFGVDKSDKMTDTQKGKTIFFDANIVLLPIQNDLSLYHYVTTETILNRVCDKINLFSPSLKMEKESLLKKLRILICAQEIEIILDSEFIKHCSEISLPIIARNCLNNGESTNLWYEQILPPETVMFTQTQGCNKYVEDALKDFIVQIGANATIGYGYCKFLKLEIEDEKNDTLIALADKALRDIDDIWVDKGKSIIDAYSGKTASFSVSIAMIGLLPTLAIYYQDQDQKSDNKLAQHKAYGKIILDVITKMTPEVCEIIPSDSKNLLKYAMSCTPDIRKKLTKDIISYAIALKQVIRTYKQVKEDEKH